MRSTADLGSYYQKLFLGTLLCSVLLGVSFFALAAMLGQLDSILAPWYTNPKNFWEMPLPFIFNQGISALLGWEIIYATIIATTISILVLATFIGWNLRSLARAERDGSLDGSISEDLWERLESNRNDRLLDIES